MLLYADIKGTEVIMARYDGSTLNLVFVVGSGLLIVTHLLRCQEASHVIEIVEPQDHQLTCNIIG